MEVINQATNRDLLLKNHIEKIKVIADRELGSGRALTLPTKLQLVDFSPPTSVDLDLKNRVYIEDLIKNIGTRQPGKYLVVRTIVNPLKENGLVEVIVEDGQSDAKAALLVLAYFDIDEFFEPMGLEKRSILIIKNPWFVVNGEPYGHGFGIRSDNPSDVEVLSWKDDNAAVVWGFNRPISSLHWNVLMGEPQGAHNVNMKYWRDRGNLSFRESHYFTAIRSYTEGLKLRGSEPKVESVPMLTNRAMAYLRVGRPKLALKDAEAALDLDPQNTKALYRKAVALCRTNQHLVALDFIKGLTIPLPAELKELQDFITNQLKDVKSNSTIKYEDTIEILGAEEYFNHVEYTGPVIIAQTPGKGRGLIATSDIKAGDLVLASRAFEITMCKNIYDLTQSFNPNFDPTANPTTSKTFLPSSIHILGVITNRLMAEPHLRKELYKLRAGPTLGYIDEDGSDGDGKTGKEPLPLDMERIKNIFSLNVRLEYRIPSSLNETQQMMYAMKNGAVCGIWILPCFINHSCIDVNAKHEIRGDFCFVTATKDIKAGEELAFNYCFPIPSQMPQSQTKSMRKQLFQTFGFECICRLCNMGTAIEDEVDSD